MQCTNVGVLQAHNYLDTLLSNHYPVSQSTVFHQKNLCPHVALASVTRGYAVDWNWVKMVAP